MTNRRSAILSFATTVAIALGSAAIPSVYPTEAMANNNCGGLNQRVCKKWEQLRGCDRGLHRTKPIGGICTRDNKLIPNPIERKIVKAYEPARRNCGALNQRVCKKSEQLRGCDPGFHRTKLVGGICTRDNKFVPNVLETGNLKDQARQIADAMLPHQRVLREIGSCVARTGGSAFKQAVDRKDMKRAAAVIFACVSPEQLRILATPPAVTAANAVGFNSISVGFGASSMFGAGLGGEAGVVLALDASVPPRFYTSGGMKFGYGAGVSGDIIASISTDRVVPGKSDGIGIGASGKAIGGAGVGVFFSNIKSSHRPFNGFSVSGGVGISFEIGTVNPTWSRIY